MADPHLADSLDVDRSSVFLLIVCHDRLCVTLLYNLLGSLFRSGGGDIVRPVLSTINPLFSRLVALINRSLSGAG